MTGSRQQIDYLLDCIDNIDNIKEFFFVKKR